MAHTVFYMFRTPPSHRTIILSEEPPDFTSTWLESDDPGELRAKLAEADFVVTGSITAAQLALAPRVRLIQMPGVGYERIDVAAAARGGFL